MEDRRHIYKALMADHIEFISNDQEESIKYLEENDIDFDHYFERSRKNVKKLLFAKKVQFVKDEVASQMTNALSLVRSNYDQSRSVLLNLLKEKAPDVQFRKLDKLGDDEIKEILKDVDLLQFIENMNKDKGLNEE